MLKFAEFVIDESLPVGQQKNILSPGFPCLEPLIPSE
jgi:hypothetical protein